MFIKDTIMSVLAGMLLKSYLLLMDLNEFITDIKERRKEKKGKICRNCGKIILRGNGVIINGYGYYYCQECIRKVMI